MDNYKKITILYSGGTDSTLTAVICLESYDEIHLLTFERFGFFNVDNVLKNVKKLKEIYHNKKILHHIIKFDKIFRMVSYENYFKNVLKFGFTNLTTCGLCKLAMHIRAAVYCIDNNINNIADGANKGMFNFPDQQEGYISLLKKYYSKLNITYENPVYNFEPPSDIDFVDKFKLHNLPGLKNTLEREASKEKTTGWFLYKKGIFPNPNIKGTQLDRKIQPRCFQFILLNIWLFWYYLPLNSHEKYREDVISFYNYKMEKMFKMLEEYKLKKEKSTLAKYL